LPNTWIAGIDGFAIQRRLGLRHFTQQFADTQFAAVGIAGVPYDGQGALVAWKSDGITGQCLTDCGNSRAGNSWLSE